MPQLDPTWYASQIFWLAICFVTLYLLLSRIAIPRIGEVLEERQERVANDLSKAEGLKREAEGVIAAYEAALAKARGEAARVIAQTSQEIAALSTQRQAALGAELTKRVRDAETRITAAKDAAKAQVREIASDVAVEMTKRLTGVAPEQGAVEDAIDLALKTETSR